MAEVVVVLTAAGLVAVLAKVTLWTQVAAPVSCRKQTLLYVFLNKYFGDLCEGPNSNSIYFKLHSGRNIKSNLTRISTYIV